MFELVCYLRSSDSMILMNFKRCIFSSEIFIFIEDEVIFVLLDANFIYVNFSCDMS